MSLPHLIAWDPREPSFAYGGNEVTQREHTRETQLKSCIRRDRRFMDEHDRCGGRENCIAVPIASAGRAHCAADSHECRARSTRGRRHEPECCECSKRDRYGAKTGAAHKKSCSGRDDPTEHREIEARDRENVRESYCSKRSLDCGVAFFRVTKHKRDERRTNRVRLIIRDARQQRLAKARTRGLAKSRERISKRCRTSVSRNRNAQVRRLDADRANDSSSRGNGNRIAVAWIASGMESIETADNSNAISDTARRRLLENTHKERGIAVSTCVRGVATTRRCERHARSIISDEDDILHSALVSIRLLKVARENVDGESARDEW